MKSKLFICCLLLIYAPMMLMQSCGPSKKTPVIGLLMDDFKVERWAKDTTYFIKAVHDLNGKVICMNAGGDANKQIEQAKTLIDKGVDVIVVVPVDLNKAAEIVLLAQKASIGVISYDRLIQNSFIDYYISFDNVKVGELQADYIRKRMGNGNIALIGGPSTDQNSYYLRYGQLGVLQPFIERGEVKIVYDKPVNNWTFDDGYKAAVECLKAKKVRCYHCR